MAVTFRGSDEDWDSVDVNPIAICTVILPRNCSSLCRLLILGNPERTKEFVEQLNKELLVKITGKLEPGTEHSFLRRRLRHNGDSIDILMSQQYREEL